MARLMIHTGSIATGFRPDRFDGDVLLFATADHAAWAPYWQPYVSGHIEVVSIETTHHKMVEPRHLLTIGSTFEQALHQTTRRAHAV
jgi:thioesterase domain-containing protein